MTFLTEQEAIEAVGEELVAAAKKDNCQLTNRRCGFVEYIGQAHDDNVHVHAIYRISNELFMSNIPEDCYDWEEAFQGYLVY